MIRRTLSLMAGGALLAALLAERRTGGRARQENRRSRCQAFRRSYSVTIAYIAEKQGFFKKHGVDVKIRPFDNGTAAARAVVAGDVDLAWSPTPPVINQISNADVPLVARLRHAEPGLGDRHHRRQARTARISPARTSASIRSAARARSRCARCSPPAARTSRSSRSSRSRSARARVRP